MPDLATLRARFAPIAARLPVVAVNLPSIASYDVLLPAMAATACATTGALAMSDSITVDAARLPLLLGELRLPTVAKLWQTFTERADREGWPSARLLATLAEFELAERAQRRIQRHLLEARLPPGKTLDSFDFATVPMVSHAHVTALASGDAWLKKGANILLFGPSGSGKSHLGAALGHALVENGYRVLFTRTTDLVQRLQTARQALSLESAIEKLDKYHLIILDDLCYVNRDQAETSALFELIAARYERRSLLVTVESTFRRMDDRLPGCRHDPRRGRPPRPSCRHSGDERRKLPSTLRRRPAESARHQRQQARHQA